MTTSSRVLDAGRIIGQRYTVRRLVARAITSSIYDAMTAPNREVLLEVFAPEIEQATPGLSALLSRFTTEVNALPTSIVLPIIEVGIDSETGSPFIASTASVTPTLAELVKLCPLGGEELAAFAARLCAALDAIHSRGLVHGALDPLTVFVGPAPRCDVRLGGLGASLLAMQSDAPPSIATDIHAAALLILFAGAGTLPDDPRAAVVAAREAEGAPPAFDARLGDPLARALSADPAARYASAGDLGRAVTDALGSSFVVSSPWLVAAPPATSVDALTTPIAAPTDPLPDAFASAPLDAAESPARRRIPPTKMIAVIAAALAVFSIGGAALAVVLAGGARHSAAVAATHASAVASASPPHSPSPPPIAVEPPPTPVVASPPTPSDTEAALVVKCIPECDWIRVDGKTVPTFPATFAPGAHVVVAKRTWHPPQTRYVKLSTERETSVQFVWFKPKGTPTVPSRPAPPKKPCGKFVQRCD